jgi:hypothetical protein
VGKTGCPASKQNGVPRLSAGHLIVSPGQSSAIRLPGHMANGNGFGAMPAQGWPVVSPFSYSDTGESAMQAGQTRHGLTTLRKVLGNACRRGTR